jgi:hypothetical protein
MLPFEFRAKEIDEHPKEENIAEPSSVEEKHQSEEAQDTVKQEDKTMENHQEAEKDIVRVPNVIDFDNKRILIRLDQTESTKGKNVVIDDNAVPRMIKPKNLEVGMHKVDERKKKSAPRPKPTSKQPLDKSTSRKANKFLSRLGGTKRHRFPSRPGGHKHWRGNSYEQPYFPIEPTYLGCATLMYPRSTPWGFNLQASYPTEPATYFQEGWIPSRPMSRPRLHGKGEQFNQEFRPIVIRGNDEKLISGNSNPRRRQNADGMVHRGGQKFKWVPINRENHAETHYGTKGGCTKTNAEKDTSLHIDLKPGVQTFP